jgi:antitoxin MazE
MIVHTKIQKWGNGLALRVSGGMREIPHFEAGTEVDVEIFEEGFLVKKSIPRQITLLPFSEAQLLENLTPEMVQVDLLANLLSNEIEE